jgi:predicted SPOUT superfamily RNA methylase MTH1
MGMPNDYVITSPDGVEVTIPHGSTNTLYRGVAVFGSGVTGYAKSKEGDKNYWGFIVDMAKMTIDTMKDKANSTQVLTDVPENAVFTDTETKTSLQKVGNE